MRQDLTDSVNLWGAFCVTLTRESRKRLPLTGRFLAAAWDADELVNWIEEIEGKDLLMGKLAVH